MPVLSNMAKPQFRDVATRLKVANRAEHRALSDVRLVKDVFLELLRGTPTLKKISEMMRVSHPLTFADSPAFSIELSGDLNALVIA